MCKRQIGNPPYCLVVRCLVPVVALLLVLTTSLSARADDAAPLTFEEHVRPIFKAQCFHCHGEEQELSGGLDIRLVRLMKEGGDSGESLVPNDVDASSIWQRIEADEMPDGPKKLTPEQKSLVRQWIEQGARTARPEPERVEEARFTFEELQHWAYQPVTRPRVPVPDGYELDTPIDGFIARRLAEHQLAFSPRADRRTLIRRVTFDLIGLPPSPDEVEQFLKDESPDAYEQLVDRMLASPQFGVRWGRHWLDVAGFAESNGGQDGDAKRPYAWRYRDYVIDSFNSSKPIDEFYIQQLAGDELIGGEADVLDSRHLELLTATGFMRMAPDPTQSSNTLADRNMAVADTIKVVSSTMLGVTVGCAQCHDHKYDPIGIDDYYRFRAIFDPAFPLQDWRQPNARLVDFTASEVRAESDKIEAQAKALDDDLNQRRNALAKKIQELKLDDVPEKDREATREAVLTDPSKRSAEQTALLDLYPMVKPVSHIIGLLVEYDGPSYRQFEKEMAKIAELRATKPPARLVMATRERPETVPVSAVFFRGNPESPGERVSPAELMVLSRNRRDIKVPENDEARVTTGRRLAYARQLTDGTHPLAARVFVNRVWTHHMGRGIVATPGDFGISGERPSHPELLDWLADDFVRHGWDQKRLHRMILLSRTYQQLSKRTPQLDTVDPENALLGRMNLRRLEAEAIRDAILAVIGNLDRQLGGPSVPVTENPEGKVVIGRRQLRDGLKAGVEGANADAWRRSAYIEVQRRLPLNMLATFDQPEMTPNCELRRPSTVATQALWFLNDAMIVECADVLARLVWAPDSCFSLRGCERTPWQGLPAAAPECCGWKPQPRFTLREEPVVRGANNDNLEAQIQELFVRMFAAPPADQETRACLEFLENQQRNLVNESTDGNAVTESKAALHAMSALCQTLFASNRFLYVD